MFKPNFFNSKSEALSELKPPEKPAKKEQTVQQETPVKVDMFLEELKNKLENRDPTTSCTKR